MGAGVGSPAEVGIYRADVIGSMLRPAWLIDARQRLRADTYLDFDDDRSGSFEPLRHLPGNQVVVLELVSTESQALENPAPLKRRVLQAAAFHVQQRLALATQCGFSSASETAEQRKITPENQVAKLGQVADVARSIWS